MTHLWEVIKNYYQTIGLKYHVDPNVFLGIHIVASPIFIFSIGWLIHNFNKKISIVAPLLISIFVFNAANIYIVVFGKNIPLLVYTIIIVTTVVSGYFSYVKTLKKLNK